MLRFPCVLKPPKRTPKWTSQTDQKGFRVESPQAFLQVYDQCARWVELLIVQEWVARPETNLYSCNAYFDVTGKPLATFVARKLRQWPPETGSSCLGEECRNDLVLQTALELFQQIGYRGFGYLEMKQDVRTGQHFMLETNVGRPTVRSPIAEIGGVELHYAAYCDLIGAPLPQNLMQTYKGAKWRHLHYDTLAAWRQWRRGELSLAAWRRSWQGVTQDALFSWRDPWPFWFDLFDAARRKLTVTAR